jgi:glycosyltransferase involved in cell wall biosynthesis
LDNSGITFIIPAHNSSCTLKECVESIVFGNISKEDEIIIIDDASTDGTLNLAYDIQRAFSQIVIVKHKYNKGSAAASRNTGIEYASNDLIFCLDSDNLLEPGSINLIRKYLLESRIDAVAFGEIKYFIGDKGNVVHTWQMVQGISFLDAINKPEQTPCSSGNYLFTKSSWLKAGRYNEGVGGAFDSWAFGLAQLASGCKMECLPGTFYYHRQGYESTYVREVRKLNLSLSVTRILVPYFGLLSNRDIEYILNPLNSKNWYSRVRTQPLRGSSYNESIFKRRFRYLLYRIANLLLQY